jgi:hypothetical protein
MLYIMAYNRWVEVPQVLTVAEARIQLSRLLARLDDGSATGPVFIGRYRRPQGVLMSTDQFEQLQRSQAVASALGSLHAEGLEEDAESRQLLDAYVSGEIDADELVTRTVARFAPPSHG